MWVFAEHREHLAVLPSPRSSHRDALPWIITTFLRNHWSRAEKVHGCIYWKPYGSLCVGRPALICKWPRNQRRKKDNTEELWKSKYIQWYVVSTTVWTSKLSQDRSQKKRFPMYWGSEKRPTIQKGNTVLYIIFLYSALSLWFTLFPLKPVVCGFVLGACQPLQLKRNFSSYWFWFRADPHINLAL